MENYPIVSIVIPAYNAQDTISKCISSIRSLNYPQHKIEVIVVDNGSTDDTAKIVKDLGYKVLNLPEGNIGEVRNYGAINAKGEILAHTDSDCILPTNWIVDSVRLLESDINIGAVGGGCIVQEDATLLERAWVSVQKENAVEVVHLPGCNFVLRKSLFNSLGGFNEDILAGEDDDLSIRVAAAGCRLISQKNCYVIHLGYPKTFWAVFKRQVWHGKSVLKLLSDSYKMFVVFIFFIGAMLCLILLLILNINSYFVWGLNVLLVILMPLLLAVRKIRRSGTMRFSYFLPLIAIYFIFLLGRCVGLIWGIFHIFNKRI